MKTYKKQQYNTKLPFDNFDINSSANYMSSMIGLQGLQLVEKFLFEDITPKRMRLLVKKDPTLIFKEIPVTTKEFFDNWYNEPCYPRQQDLVNAMIGTNPLKWDITYEEGIALWGLGCVSEDTIIEDVVTKESMTIKEWAEMGLKPFVRTFDQSVIQADIPFLKGKADIYEVIVNSIRSVKVTLKHKFHTTNGWVELGDLNVGDKIAVEDLWYDSIISIKKVAENQDYYDIHVPEKNNYLAQGIYHHNSGKDHTSAKILTYYLYWLLCLRNPQAYFGLGRGTAIEMGNISISGSDAENIFFRDLKNVVRNIINPKTGKNWFEEQGYDLKSGHGVIGKRVIQLNKHNIYCHSLDSQEHTGVGKNLLVVVFDEIGGFVPSKAKELYSITKKTQRSRYASYLKSFLLSFKRDDNDYMMVRYNEAETEPNVWRDRAATWEVNLGRKKSDFTKEYLRNPEEAKRVYEGIGTTRVAGYFGYPAIIRQNANKNRKNPVLNGAMRVKELKYLVFCDWFRGLKGVDYYVHVDLAKGKSGGDACGFACGHAIEKMPVRFNDVYIEELKKEGIDISHIKDREYGKGVYIDLMLQLLAPAGKEIMFEDIVSLIEVLKYDLGFNIRLVTYDGWQSTGSIQQLRQRGISAETLSVDKDPSAYDTMKGLMYQGLLNYYYHLIFLRECEELIRIPKKTVKAGYKIDHPDISYKRGIEEGNESGCLTGDTKIKLLNGKNVSIKWLCENYEPNKFFTYSFSRKRNKVVVGGIKNPRITGKNVQLVKVILDNGKSIKCTSDHKFLMRDKTYRQAQELHVGDSLMPIRTRISKWLRPGYREFYNPMRYNWEFVHHMVADEKLNDIRRHGYLIHHRDFNPKNNNPSNLKIMSFRKHTKLHQSVGEQGKKVLQRPDVVKNRRIGLDKYVKSKKGREKSRWIMTNLCSPAGVKAQRERMEADPVGEKEKRRMLGHKSIIKYNKSKRHSEEIRSRWSNPKYKDWCNGVRKRFINRIKKMWEDPIYREWFKLMQVTDDVCGKIRNRRMNKDHPDFIPFREFELNYKEQYLNNHKVKKVIWLNKKEDVYDIEIPKYHNFALKSGVFVHNSKDISDCCAAICYNIIKRSQHCEMWFGDIVGTPVSIRPDELEDHRQRQVTQKAKDNAARIRVQEEQDLIEYGKVPALY